MEDNTPQSTPNVRKLKAWIHDKSTFIGQLVTLFFVCPLLWTERQTDISLMATAHLHSCSTVKVKALIEINGNIFSNVHGNKMMNILFEDKL